MLHNFSLSSAPVSYFRDNKKTTINWHLTVILFLLNANKHVQLADKLKFAFKLAPSSKNLLRNQNNGSINPYPRLQM